VVYSGTKYLMPNYLHVKRNTRKFRSIYSIIFGAVMSKMKVSMSIRELVLKPLLEKHVKNCPILTP
jgi:hypothetical protein